MKRKQQRFDCLFYIYMGILAIICVYKYNEIDVNGDALAGQPLIVGNSRKLLSIETTEHTSIDKSANNSEPECVRPDIEQFPKGVFTKTARLHGAIIIHFLIAFYMFIGLSIICDNYFVPSLEAICQVLDLKDDVAGATLMAAGSSAPELATTVVTLFIAKDVDIGIGTVVGSAVFNVMFIISIIALFSGSVITLQWFPILRDSFIYLISIFAMVLVIVDERVYWYEALILLGLYVVYIVIMIFNTRIEIWFQEHLKFMKSENDDKLNVAIGNNYHTLENETQLDGLEANMNKYGGGSNSSSNSICDNGISTINNNNGNEIENKSNNDFIKEEKNLSPFNYPRNENFLKKILFIIVFPLQFATYFTIPNVQTQKWKRFYAITFASSLIWLSLLSYTMVWMITIIGYTFNIPDTVMGLTFIAFGASVPDGLASLIVARNGRGNMAVSNAIGSNIFDILICLGVPWLLGCLFINDSHHIDVKSRGLTYSSITLFATVLILILGMYLNKWKLDKKLGIILMIVYVLFIVLSSLYELNILGSNHLPMCLDSNY